MMLRRFHCNTGRPLIDDDPTGDLDQLIEQLDTSFSFVGGQVNRRSEAAANAIEHRAGFALLAVADDDGGRAEAFLEQHLEGGIVQYRPRCHHQRGRSHSMIVRGGRVSQGDYHLAGSHLNGYGLITREPAVYFTNMRRASS
ncbi:hypothetical protein [Nocardia salmonicida]|uniref:hypothetical protein n=1 Tax=Nocardia salmonicida TaxID=53431 RepID=UPI0037874EB4